MLPNFIIIGAAKSGTTSLYHYLSQHPEIYLCPSKEPNYFAFPEGRPNLRGPLDEARMHRLNHSKTVTNIEAYEALFAAAQGHKVIGEASLRYLYTPKAPKAIHRVLGSPKLIAILRHPADRAYSHFIMNRQRGIEPFPSFADALDAEDERVRLGWDWDWHYTRVGFYAAQLERFIDCHEVTNLRVILYDDFKADQSGVVREILSFLDVDPSFLFDVSNRYRTSVTTSANPLSKLAFSPEDTWLGRIAYPLIPRRLHDAAQGALQGLVNRLPMARVPPMAPELRNRLVKIFHDDVVRLALIVQRDLSSWRSSDPAAE